MQEISFARTAFLDDIGSRSERYIHLILIATKPDIIKQPDFNLNVKKQRV